MADMNAADFAKELLRSCQNAKPYDKKADSKNNDMAQLNILLSKFTKNFDENFKKMENYLNQIAAAAKNNQKSSEESAKLTKMQIDAYKGSKLKKNTEAEQNYFKQNKKVGDAALRYYKKALEKGSIYVHDVGAHKFLNAINTTLGGANPFGNMDISKMFTAEFYKSIEDGIGSAATTANEAIKKEPPADAKKPPSKGGGEDKEVHLSEHDPLETSASMIRIAKVLSLIDKVESALFGLGEKQKGIQQLTFGGLVKNEVAFMSASREAAFELGNATKETQVLLTSNEKIGRTVLETGADRDDFQQNYLKNLKAGVKNIKTAQQITVSQLNTERQLGMAAGDLNETFRDFAVAGRMNEGQIADMGRGMREVARNTGLTGESLKAAVSSSKSFTENLRKAATLTATASKNVLEATANFQKLGVAEAGGELLKKLTSSTDLLMDSTSKTATFLYMAAGSAGKIGDLQKGTLLKSKQGIKELAKGMENVLKKFGVSSLEAVDQLSDEAKVSINFQLKTTQGVELGEARSLIEAVK
jgi:DNA-binding phage protein